MAMNQQEEKSISSISFSRNPADFAKYSKLEKGLEQSRYCEMEKSDKVSDEVLESLPCDPFGMEVGSTLATFSGWLEGIRDDLESSLPCDPFGMNLGAFENWFEGVGHDVELNATTCITSNDLDTGDMAKGEDQTPKEVNLVWDDSFKFLCQINDLMMQHERFLTELREGGLVSDNNMEELVERSHGGSVVGAVDDTDISAGVVEGGPAHDGLLFSLRFLAVKDLFSVERVCKSLRDAVRYDPLLWKRICIDHPLSMSIDDNALIKLTDRAQGTLECLVLVECRKITDFGLGHVLQSNPRLWKLSVPRCQKVSIEGILFNLNTLKSMGKLGLKLLRISEVNGVKKEHFEELKSLLGGDNPIQPHIHKPQFYGIETLYLSCEDNRILDIEKCPTCDRYREVYDCTLKSCSTTSPLCRGCTLCIPRCIYCGRCIRGLDYVETFHFDLACFPCFRKHPSLHYMEEKSSGSHSSDYILVQKWELHG